MITTLGRVLVQHWPALLAWFLAGRLVHYVLLIAAAYAGSWSSTAGLLVLPLAILARLISLVAMFLVVRDALRELSAVAPAPPTPAERRTTFLNTLLASILPFFAIYAAWGMLKDDFDSYSLRALSLSSGRALQQVVEGGTAERSSEIATLVGFNVLTVSIVIITFAGRWAWKKWPTKLPAPFSAVAVYFEAVWVLLSVALVSDALGFVNGWIDTRVGLQWIGQVRDWVDAQLVPVSWVWNGIEWFIGEVAGLTVQPLAWLAIAGVIYGQAIAAEKPTIEHELFRRVNKQYERVPSLLRRMLGNLASEFTSRFKPIGDAVVLMWRAGPVLIGSYVLGYTLVLAGHDALGYWISRWIGPHDLPFWQTISVTLFLGIAIVIEPLRIALVSAAYDTSLGALRRQHARTATAEIAETSGQGSTENLTNSGTASNGATSIQNGPSASSGTMNGTSSS